MADRIAGWLRHNARLPGHPDPIQPRDIMILLPRREPFGGEVIRQLKQRGIPVAGADRVVLTEQIAAMDLIALGRFVLQREDDLTLAALLRSPLCGLEEKDLYDLAHNRKADLWSALVAQASRPSCRARLSSAMLERADYAPPFEFYSHALTALGGQEKLLARLGAESADAIDEFLSLTLTHERTHSPSLESFLDWVERGDIEIKRDMERGRNEVRVMTVHGAKGLEADIVILPDTASLPGGLRPQRDALYFTAEGVLFPCPRDEAPDRREGGQGGARRGTDARASPPVLCRADPRPRPALHLRLRRQEGCRKGSWYELAQAAARSLIATRPARGEGEIITIGTVDEEQIGGKSAKTTPRPWNPARLDRRVRAARTGTAAPDPPV